MLKILVLALLCVFTTYQAANSEPLTTTTIIPIETGTTSESNTLCLDLDSISLTNIEWSSQSKSKWAQTKGIFYVYGTTDSYSSYRYTQFPISQQDMDQNVTKFTFEGDEQSVGCWTSPTFNELKIRFKIYQFYHTALKAESIITVPASSDSTTETDVELTTLSYEYSDVTVNVEFTLNWQDETDGSDDNALSSQIETDSDAKSSDELIDDIMTADQVVEDETIMDEVAVDDDYDNGNSNSSSSWMLLAALCSSILGLFMLIYVCIWTYKQYKRRDYESISINQPNKLFGNKNKLKMFKRISLRNLHINSEEKTIMHPSSSSYTFDDD